MKKPIYIDSTLRIRLRELALQLERKGIKAKSNEIAEAAILKHVTAEEKRLAS